MLGPIIGDVIGSFFEYANTKREDFPLFDLWSTFTDDTVMTVAIADALSKKIQSRVKSHESRVIG